MAKLIIVGQVPPPHYGQSIMIKTMIDTLDELDFIHVPLRFSKEVNEHGRFAVGKLFHTIGVTFCLARLLIHHRHSVIYFPAPPPKWSTILRDWIILTVCRPLCGKIVFHFHAYGLGEFLERHPWFARVAWAFKKPDVAIVLGRLCRKDAEVIKARRVCEIPYGIDVPVVQSKEMPAESPVRILFVGLHIPSKGIGDVLETARLLKERRLDFEVHTVGPWRSKEIEKAMITRRKETGLEDRVTFRGELVGTELWKEYAEADILFFPTFFEFETFGVVVLEAMAYGLPVVASRWRGPGDLVSHGETGLLCETRNLNAYADALSALITDRSLRDSMGGQARQQYNEKFVVNVFANTMRTLFEELNVDRLDG